MSATLRCGSRMRPGRKCARSPGRCSIAARKPACSPRAGTCAFNRSPTLTLARVADVRVAVVADRAVVVVAPSSRLHSGRPSAQDAPELAEAAEAAALVVAAAETP